MNPMYEEQIHKSVEELFQNMAKRVSEEELERVKGAYALAFEAHKNQRRKSGEPYIIHPIAVARIVAEELMLDSSSVMAAFLHDVVEDTSYTIGYIEAHFGKDVAFLVRAVTKQKKERYEMSKQLDNFKQMLDSIHYDIRAILIKLADRLHNMRTLNSMIPNKQMKIAGETDYFYAPLANRLGLYSIKSELENLSMRFRCPHEYNCMKELLKQDEERNRHTLESFTQKIQAILLENGYNVRIRITYRMPYSLWRKMKKKNTDFDHLEHRHFVCIIFPDDLDESEKTTCLKIYSLLTDKAHFEEKPGGISNYIDHPKENGYQSFHVHLLSDHGAWEEVHICSERMVRNSSLGCVAQRTEGNITKWIDNFRSVLKDISRNGKEEDFIENVASSFYNDDIVVYSPKGKAVVLPQRASALDFAFEIHSHLGEHAKYARVNGALCSVKTVLKRGDRVEIGWDDETHLQEDWQDAAITYKAKRFLRNYFLKKHRLNPYKRCPKCNPIPGDEVIGFKEMDKSITVHKRDCQAVIRLATEFGDSIVSVEFEEQQDVLYPVSIHIKAVDRYHLLSDLIDCITNRLQLSIDRLETQTNDAIVDCTIWFEVHSYYELQAIIGHLHNIKGVDQVQPTIIRN